MSYVLDSTYLDKSLTITSASDKQDLTTSFDTVTGSEITYTPNSFGVNVVYEYNTVWSYKDSTSKLIFRLTEYNAGTSSWDVIDGSYVTLKSLKNGAGLINYKYAQQKWVGSKQLRLECKDSTTSLEGYLHSNWSQDKYYNPSVECTTI